MKMKKIALAMAVLGTASLANAAWPSRSNIEIDLGSVLETAAEADSSALNLSINNTDLVDGSVYVRATTEDVESLVGTVIENDIKTTAIGAVQSGSIAIENAAVATDTSEFTGALELKSIDAENTKIDYVNNSIDKNVSDITASTTNTAVGEVTDNSEITDVNFNYSDVDFEVKSIEAQLDFSKTLTALNTEFSAVNAAYNNADIDASVTIGADYQGYGAISGVNLSTLDGTIATTAIGAVQSGTITVTVK